ncbi:iron-containing alcohol dehydrogenase [Mollicutes bacterium LVI A0039]|nr:iron-containing alcohol dehydrogenase [Mollicutes bacterium LVI A0039]
MNYEIIIERDCFKQQVLKIMPKLIIVDRNVELKVNDQNQLILDETSTGIPVWRIATSEESKNFEMYFKLLNVFERYQLNRNDIVMIVGGGVLIDVASFAASTYKRGIKYVNVPTTTLSMIDSSVGSKNGLNYMGQKNLIGNITDPISVVIDPAFLSTLDQRHFNNGIAEAIKIGYLGNADILATLAKEDLDIIQLIEECCSEKIKYVEQDKFDHGHRNHLNFGHTFGHAIETLTNFTSVLHGEAVSIGMVIASGYDPELIALLKKFNLPVELPTHLNLNDLLEAMAGDKKNTSEKIKLVLKNPELKIVELEPQAIKQLFNTNYRVTNQSIGSPITVNKSKSHIHRLLAASLATKAQIKFEFERHTDLSDDVIQSLKIIEAVGGVVTYLDGALDIDCRHVAKPQGLIKIYKSATTYRIFTPILCSMFGPCDIELDAQLASRPHDVFAHAVDGTTHNLQFDQQQYQIDGSISSQFISGYILALIAKGQNATITITGELTSVPYIDMTVKIANQFGYQVARNNHTINIQGSAKPLDNSSFTPEPDMSSLSYFVVYNKLCEITGKHKLLTLPSFSESMQADRVIVDILDSAEIDMTNCPDLLPILVGYGLLNNNGLVLNNIDRIKYKECDRTQAMIDNFADLGALERTASSLIIKPALKIAGRTINTFGDHRIAMAATIIAKFSDGDFIIDDYTVVHKSFPTFFEQCLGGSDECIK